jgi:hypothetical protein
MGRRGGSGILAAMRVLLVLLILWFAAAAFVYPPLIESRDGECGALEQRYADLASHDDSGLLRMGALRGSSSSTSSAAAFAKDRYPLLPAAIGCTLSFWGTMVGAPPLSQPAAAGPSAPPPERSASIEAEQARASAASTISRDITPNGDPISPATIFTLPMDSVAIRVDYAGGKFAASRFQLRQGKAVVSSCSADKTTPGIAWCKFNVSLRKGNYAIAFTANNALVGQFPFTVIGR